VQQLYRNYPSILTKINNPNSAPSYPINPNSGPSYPINPNSAPGLATRRTRIIVVGSLLVSVEQHGDWHGDSLHS
jgi:hypothetical protein